MSRTRTAILDLHVDPQVLADTSKRSEIIKCIDELLDTLLLKKQQEQFVKTSFKALYKADDDSITCRLSTFPFGLLTLTFEDQQSVSSFFDTSASNLLELCDSLRRQLNVLVVPVIKRERVIPQYFATTYERFLEYDFDRIIYEANSKFQNIKIFHSPKLGNVLFLDDLENLGESDISYTFGLMKKGTFSYAGKEVLILGGGDGALLHQLLKENPKFIRMVDIDQMVIDACRLHLRGACGDALDSLIGANYEVIVDDCIKKLDEFNAEGRRFDVVINDLTDLPLCPSLGSELWAFAKKIITMSLLVLKDDGHYLNHSFGESCDDLLKLYESMLLDWPVKLNFEHHSAYVPSFMENWVFYDVWKA